MQLEVHDFCTAAPKLMALLPEMCDALEKRKQAIAAGEEYQGKVFLIEGSRGSGKTMGTVPLVGELLESGYADSATLGVITENAVAESICARFCKTMDDYIDWSGVRSGNMYYPLQSGAEVYFKGFHPSRGSALKTNERAKDILLIDEVENWKQGAAATLNTYIRACGLIILISNHFSKDVKDWAKAFNATYLRIDYWENPYLPKYVKDGWDKLKEENYDLWRATIMYDDSDQFAKIMTDKEIFSCLDAYEPTKPYVASVMGVDVAIGGGDCSVMSCAYMDRRGHVVVDVRDGVRDETMGLIGKAVLNRAKWRAEYEIYDCAGQGKAVIQARAPGTVADRARRGIVEFNGAMGGTNVYANARTHAYGLMAELAREGKLHFIGDPAALEYLQEDLRAQMLGTPPKYGQIALAKKESIKKILGRSPDYSDSVSMAVWFMMTKAIKQTKPAEHVDFATTKKSLRVTNTSRYAKK